MFGEWFLVIYFRKDELGVFMKNENFDVQDSDI